MCDQNLVTLARTVTSANTARALSQAERDALRVAARDARRAADQTADARAVIQAVAWLTQAAREDLPGPHCPYCGAGECAPTCWHCGGR